MELIDTQQKLSWSAPKIQILDVILDTRLNNGSGGDGAFATSVSVEATEAPIPLP